MSLSPPRSVCAVCVRTLRKKFSNKTAVKFIQNVLVSTCSSVSSSVLKDQMFMGVLASIVLQNGEILRNSIG